MMLHGGSVARSSPSSPSWARRVSWCDPLMRSSAGLQGKCRLCGCTVGCPGVAATLQSHLLSYSLLEMMLESALTDLKESGPATLPGLTHNALKLLRLLQDFLFSEGHNNQALWSEKVRGCRQGPTLNPTPLC